MRTIQLLDEIKNRYSELEKKIEKTSAVTKLQGFFFTYIEDIRKLFNCSILVSEYYGENCGKTLNEIEKIHKKIEQLLDTKKWDEGPEFAKALLITIRSDFQINTKYALFYQFIIAYQASRQFKDMSTVILNVDLDNEIRGIAVRNSSGEPSEEDLELYFYLLNIKLSEIEEGYLCTTEQLRELVGYATFIRSKIGRHVSQSDKVFETILHKCHYIILKILRRFRKSHPELSIQYRRNTDDGFVYNIDTLQKVEFLGPYKVFDVVSNNHYTQSSETHKEDREAAIRRIRALMRAIQQSVPVPTLRDIHFLVKYFRTNAAAIAANQSGWIYEEVIASIEKLHAKCSDLCAGTTVNQFNLFGYTSACYLMHNSLLNLKANRCLADIDTILAGKNKNKFEKIITSIQNIVQYYYANDRNIFCHDEKMPNLYRFRIYFDFVKSVAKKLELIIKQSDPKSAQTVETNIFLERFFHGCYRQGIEYVKCIQLSQSHRIMPMYLTMEECDVSAYPGIILPVVKLKTGVEYSLNLFLDSAYILPPDYTYLEVENRLRMMEIRSEEELVFHALWNKEFERHTALLEEKERAVMEELEKSKVELDNNLKTTGDKQLAEVEKKVKDGQITAIQVIGIFMGIVTFILGGLTVTLKVEHSYGEVLLFLFVLASCMSIFIALIKMIVNSDESSIELAKLNPWQNGKIYVNKYIIFILYCASVFGIAIFLLLKYRDVTSDKKPEVPTGNNIYINSPVEKDSASYFKSGGVAITVKHDTVYVQRKGTRRTR